MIQLKPKTIPDDLFIGQHHWTATLLQLVKKYNGYENIPAAQKNDVLQNYNLPGVKKQLKAISNGKCFYCESFIEHIDYPHIEHFWPKSLYPKFAFKWSNLLLSCARCNIPKGDYDTKTNLFINPINDNPEEYLAYSELRVIVNPTSPDVVKSQNTIQHCDLRRKVLYKMRSPLRIEFNELEDDLDIIMKEYNSLTQRSAKLKRVIKIHDSLENLKNLCSWKNQYSGYMRDMVRKSDLINDAVSIINLHKRDFGITEYSIV